MITGKKKKKRRYWRLGRACVRSLHAKRREGGEREVLSNARSQRETRAVLPAQLRKNKIDRCREIGASRLRVNEFSAPHLYKGWEGGCVGRRVRDIIIRGNKGRPRRAVHVVRSRSISQFLFLVPQRVGRYARWTRDVNSPRTGTARYCPTGSLRIRQHGASRRSLRRK